MLTDYDILMLKKIPFCEIEFDSHIDISEIAKEIINNTEWYDYTPPGYKRTKSIINSFQNYKGLTLLTFDPDRSQSDIIEGTQFKQPFLSKYENYYDVPLELRKIYSTSSGTRFPKTIEFIKSISKYPRLAKIVISKGQHALSWHSHQRLKNKQEIYEEPCILHFPIVSSLDMIHMVSRKYESGAISFEKEKYILDKNILCKNFDIHKLYFFNSYLWHACVNFSNQTRISLLLNNDIRNNPPLESLVKNMVDKYDGPLIDNSIQ